MKIILCLCLVAPMFVLGSVIPAESDVEFEAFVDLATASTEEQKKCVAEAMDTLQKENPDLDWWFNKINNLMVTFQTKYETCAAMEGNAKFKCFKDLLSFYKAEREHIKNSLPEEKNGVLVELQTAVHKCLQ